MILSQSTANQGDNGDAYRFLCSLDTFSQLPPQELKALADLCRFATVDAGQYLSIEGEEDSPSGFIVVSGRLAMMKSSANGKELIVELLPPGDIFGLLQSLTLEKLPLQLSARAHSTSKVLWMPLEKLDAVLKAHPGLYKEFVAHLLVSLHSSYRIARGLAHDRVVVRIASVLCSLALKFSRPPPALQNYTIDITRQQLADLTGTTPESAIRVTRSMQRAGLIDIKHPGIVRVLNLPALTELAEL